MNQHLRNEAVQRALRQQRQERKTQADKITTKPAAKKEEDQQKHAEELPCIILPEGHESQIGASNLKEGDVVVYLHAVTFKSEVFKNISKRGESAVRDYVSTKPAYFLITREDCVGDVLKALVEDSINSQEEKE
jgi:hypothetical protein